MDSEIQPRRLRRKWVLLGALALLFLLVLLTFVCRRSLSGWWLSRSIERLTGVETVTEVTQLGLDEATVDIRVPGLGLELEGLRAKWGLLSFPKWSLQLEQFAKSVRVGPVLVENSRMDLQTKVAGTSPNELELHFFSKSATSGESQLDAFHLSVSGTRETVVVSVDGVLDQKALSLSFSGDLKVEADGSYATGELSTQLFGAQVSGPVTFRAPAGNEPIEVTWNDIHVESVSKGSPPWWHQMKVALSASYSKNRLESNVIISPFQSKQFQLRSVLNLELKGDPQGELNWSVKSKSEKPLVMGRGDWKGLVAGASLGEGKIDVPNGKLTGNLSFAGARWETKTNEGFSLERFLTNFEVDRQLEVQASVQLEKIQTIEETGLYPVGLGIDVNGSWPTLSFKTQLEDLLGTVWLEAQGKLDGKKESFSVQWDQKWELDSDDFDLGGLHEMFEEDFKTSGGYLRSRGRLQWANGKWQSTRSKLVAKGISWQAGGIPVQDASTEIAFASLLPVRSSPAELKIGQLGEVLPVSEATVGFVFDEKGLSVGELNAQWCEGKLRVEPFQTALSPVDFSTVIHIGRVAAQTVLEGAKIEQVRARGILSGVLPVRFHDNFLEIKNGVLKSEDQGGWIQYKNEILAGVEPKIEYLDQLQRLLAMGQQAIAFKALDNFYFKGLRLDITREKDKGLSATALMEGKNPNLANGQPFRFTIGLTGQLEQTVKQSLLRAFMDPEAFARKVQERVQ